MKRIFGILLFLLMVSPAFGQTSASALRNVLVGKHKLSLQWISWTKFGSVQISQRDHVYWIKGEQRSPTSADFLAIEGIIEPVSEKELTFTGKILTRVSYLYGGETCEKEGTFTFKATGNRKYWRLQQMQNCDGISVDYVDIYFK